MDRAWSSAGVGGGGGQVARGRKSNQLHNTVWRAVLWSRREPIILAGADYFSWLLNGQSLRIAMKQLFLDDFKAHLF
jgi:hypothetical protein